MFERYFAKDAWCRKHSQLSSHSINNKPQVKADLGSNVAQESKGGVSNQISGIDLKQIDAINGDELSGAVRLLEQVENGGFSQWDAAVHESEAGLAVLDPNLVGVGGSEEEVNGEREGSD